MGKSSLILAALAKAALPGVDFNRAVDGGSDSNLKVAVLFGTDGRTVVAKRPVRQAARNQLELEVRALQALSEATRSRLPFAAETLLNRLDLAPNDSVWFFDQLEGNATYFDKLSPSGTLAESIGEALGAIHNLPLSVVTDAFLPEYNPADIALKYVTEMDKMAETGKVPPALLDRWQSALEDVSLFRYAPTVVHGSIDSDTVLNSVVDHAQVVSGITNWSELHIGDPAEDFSWIFSAALPELEDAILLAYNTRHPNSDATLRQRAQLYSELYAGRWLLHGLALGDAEIVAEAEEILADIAQALENDELPPLSKVLAPIAAALPLIETTGDLTADFDAVESESNIEGVASAEEASATEPIEVIEVEATEAQQTADSSAEGVPEPATEPVELVDDKTRPIELPAKSDNELF